MDSVAITQSQARRIWLHAQKLDTPAPFGHGPDATPAAVRHLGYVQIDTIHVPERPLSIVFCGKDRGTLFVAGRRAVYVLKMKVKGS